MGRKKENKIYTMFDYNGDVKKSKCVICNQYIKGNHGANLLRHFYSQHRQKYYEIQKLNTENIENHPSSKAKSIMECCTRLVTVHGRPINLVEDEAFKEILKKIPTLTQPDQDAINAKNIRNNISEKAYEVRLQISKELKKCLLALKVDVASIKLRRFLGLNVQYILDGKIVLRNLSVVELHDRNTGEYLKENVATCLSRFGLTLQQILTITTDNGANMLKMVSKIDEYIGELSRESTLNESLDEYFDEFSGEIRLDEDNGENIDDDTENIELEVDDAVVQKVQGVRCAAHCLQLAVKDACQDSRELLEQCRQIVRNLRTPNMTLKLKEQKLPQPIIDMPVRWDSTANMLESLQKLKSFCMANLNVPESTWSDIDKFLQILQPCRCLSKILQKEQLTFGDFYLSWMRCRHQLSQIDDPFASLLESCMTNRQASLFENDNFLAAVYLDPRINSILTTEQRQSVRSYLINVYKRIMKLEKRLSSPEPGTSRQVSATSNFSDFLHQQFAHTRQQNPESIPNSLDREINFKLMEFLNEPLLPPESNILEYWEKKKFTDPYLYNMAKVVLATPPTSVSVERLFSSLKYVLSNLRMRLNDYIIEDILLVRNNQLYSK